mmetsp:Transcript_4892/g.7250  ORF Transcript_4892/g.7250 Transcript_4892/m.7250 type:complete len:80 (-) Transcript_4892:371-610(-)
MAGHGRLPRKEEYEKEPTVQEIVKKKIESLVQRMPWYMQRIVKSNFLSQFMAGFGLGMVGMLALYARDVYFPVKTLRDR